MWAAVVRSDSSFMAVLEKVPFTEDTSKMRKAGEKGCWDSFGGNDGQLKEKASKMKRDLMHK